ncbi:MAG: DUF4859 domain-containing protein [Bacteroidaceae bacterium]|nr:DUF4859 domain-containing protein [Bacteroidaceae bacterium]
MKPKLLFALTCILLPLCMSAAKTVYIPSTWAYNSSTQEYTENGNSDLQWSFNRSKQSDNCIVFWQKGFGTNPKDADISFDPDAVLQVAEQCYAKNVTELGFSCSNMLNKYKLMILVSYTNDWVCYGGGYDFEVSALWIGPSAVNPAGHSLGHEVGHSFHYMCYAEAANYNHNSSSTNNTGFHLNNGNGQCIWEQTAQWQANQSYPELMFAESYPLFGNNANYAFSHEWMRYQSYWFHYFLSDYYNDRTIISQIWKTPMTGQTQGNATDFCQALMKLKNLTASQFYALYFDYALHCATFDFSEAASYRDNYIGRFDYHAVPLGDKKYQVSYSSTPQSTGFNVIELAVPASGTTISTKFTALQPGCALQSADPGVYNNGVDNALVSANVSTYNNMTNTMQNYRGFRVGYVFLKNDGTRQYVNDNTVHCTGTDEKTETISTTVPANTSRMFLVVAPALTTYVKHPWQENITLDDQWPYRFELVGTDATSVSPDVEEPAFTQQIDGRDISDVTLTYNVTMAPSSSWDGATFSIGGSALNALATAFQMSADNIFSNAVTYASSQSNGTIMEYGVNADGTLASAVKSTNGDFGHWFDQSGPLSSYGGVACAEWTKSTKSVFICQMPNANSLGTMQTIREALVYKNASGATARATFVFNIKFQNVNTAYAYLADIDYTDPTVKEKEETLNVERYPALAYGTTEATVDLTAAKTFLGVEEVTTDMLRIVNPDGTLISDYAPYDGWFDADGVATPWGTNAKINVKFFEAISSGTYTICDMNGADVIGNTYTVKWALVNGEKTYTYNINVTFVEKPAAEITLADLTQKDTQEINFTSALGQKYESFTSDVDIASILTTLGVSTLNDLTIYAVQSDGSLDDNYKLGGTDGWRNASGDWQAWGNDAFFGVKADFALSATQIYFVGGMEGKNTTDPATYTATYAFVKNGSATHDAVILKVNLIYPEPAGEDIILADTETSYTVKSGNKHNVTLQRSLPAGKWLTFCAPFNIYSDQWAAMGIEAVQNLTGVTKNGNSIVLNFSDTGAIMVGEPVLIKMSETKTGITMQQTGYNPCDLVSKTTVSSGTVTAEMIGTYVKMQLPNHIYYLQDDKFRYTDYTSDKTTAMKAWRAYFTVTDTASEVKALRYNLDGEEVEPTAIEGLEVIIDSPNAVVYDLGGRRVEHPVKGLYIVNGKKVFVK